MINKILLTILPAFLFAQTIQNVPISKILFFKEGKTLVEHEGNISITNKTAYVSILENADIKTIKVYSNDKINVSEINLPLHIEISGGKLYNLKINDLPVSITYKVSDTEADLLEGIVVDVDTTAKMLYLKKKVQDKEIFTALPTDRIIQVDVSQKKLKFIEIKTEKPTATLNIKYKYFIDKTEWEPATDYEVKNGSFFLKKEVWIRYLGDTEIPESNCIFYDTKYTNDINEWKNYLYCKHLTGFKPYSSKRITCGSELIECERKVSAEIEPVFTIENFPLDTVPYKQKVRKIQGVLDCFLGKRITQVSAPGLAEKIKIKGKEKAVEHWENVEYQGKSYDIYFIQGSIFVENTSATDINIDLKKNIIGIIEQTSDSNIYDEHIISGPNRKTTLQWDFDLKAGDIKVILYKYKLYVPEVD